MVSSSPTLDNTWGAALIGMILASILYGITTLQLYIYFNNYPNDERRLKILAIVTWLLDTTSLVLVCNGVYTYLVTDMHQRKELLKVNRSLDLDPLIMGCIGLLTHTYLGARVWRVCNKNTFLAMVLGILTCSLFGVAVAATVMSFEFTYWSEKASMKPLALAGTVLLVLLDTLIASILCIYLVKQRATGRDLRRVVRRVIIFAINTGLASSVLSVVNLVMFFAFPETMIFLATNFIFSKVYANCLLANLNARESLRSKGYLDDDAPSLNLSALRDTVVSPIVYRGPESHIGSQPSLNMSIVPGKSKDNLFSPA
ncbi:hypothetical protein GALMADRAFT_924903 [Galerina marginata CBS 339.88]|uniref:DUF6534 domain-containing protein n=1 Tax=Galerina marginata (strain CBS 339.88) TaxID=685588 RepID=A0A067SE80_GALM3|nr:hypothetical protein GALMADRAFT_924903 [Galerina marginata CBS 339.88]